MWSGSEDTGRPDGPAEAALTPRAHPSPSRLGLSQSPFLKAPGQDAASAEHADPSNSQAEPQVQ